jgi:hypothetical protein
LRPDVIGGITTEKGRDEHEEGRNACLDNLEPALGGSR